MSYRIKMGFFNMMLCAFLVLSALFVQLCSPVPAVYAAFDDASLQSSAKRMLALKVINGVTPGTDDVAPNANLTRAQLVTILVRAFGQESNAKYLNGAAAYPDTANHPWASGYIAMAKSIVAERSNGKESLGLTDGTFNPDGNVTVAEAITFLMKFLGVKSDTTKAWPDNYLQGAIDAGLITADDGKSLAAINNTVITRGLAFYLADRAFYSYTLADGKTVYTEFVDTEAPVLTVDPVPATTSANQITISATTQGAIAVSIQNQSVALQDNKFSSTLVLKSGRNEIEVVALDLAGNAAKSMVTVTYAPAAATIEADSITVAVGQTVVVQAIVKDKDGNVLPNIPLQGNSDIGTYDNGKFIAGSKAGSGTLTLRAGEIQTKAAVIVTEATPTLEPVAGNTSSNRKRNRETVLQPIPNQGNKEGDTVSFQVYGTGDGPLSYAAEGLPGGIMIDEQTGIISGKIGYKTVTPTPTVTQATYSNITVTARGGNGVSTQAFNWVIDNVDTTPVLAPISDKTSNWRANVEAYVNASDMDGDTLTYTWDGGARGLTLDPATGKISGVIEVPMDEISNYYIITITVRDNTPSNNGQYGPQDQATFTFKWTVNY